MKKILITGNSGYIGSHLSKILLNFNNYEIHGLDKKKPIIPLHKFYYQDIRDADFVINENYDTVIHLAAEVAVGRSVNDPILYYTTNSIGTLNVLKNISTNNFILGSTGSALAMNNPYGISKRAAEDIVFQFYKETNISSTVFRFYNVVGTDGISPTNPDGLFYNLIKAKDTGFFKLFGDDYATKDGTCERDYTHVNEICLSLIKAIDSPTNQIENLGHGIGTTVKEMIDLFKKVNNCEFEVLIEDRRVGDIERSVLDNPSSFMEKRYTLLELLKL
jgi:UDP-glucose 4-epimerase